MRLAQRLDRLESSIADDVRRLQDRLKYKYFPADWTQEEIHDMWFNPSSELLAKLEQTNPSGWNQRIRQAMCELSTPDLLALKKLLLAEQAAESGE